MLRDLDETLMAAPVLPEGYAKIEKKINEAIDRWTVDLQELKK